MTRFLNYGQVPGGYPSRLLAMRQWFDLPQTPLGGEYEQPSGPVTGLIPEKKSPSGERSLAIPSAIRGAAQYGLDLLASPYTGTLPESFVSDVALNALGGPAEAGALRTFLGIRSETADLPALRRAIQLEKKGVSPEMVRRATGWGRDVAGNWNYEISDQQARFQPQDVLRKQAREPGGQLEMFKLDPKTERARIKELREQGFKTTMGEVY